MERINYLSLPPSSIYLVDAVQALLAALVLDVYLNIGHQGGDEASVVLLVAPFGMREGELPVSV